MSEKKRPVVVEAFTVPESTRIDFTKRLLTLRDEEDVSEIQFPATLTNIERKFLHALSSELGLKSKSVGKEEERFIIVSKPDEDVSNAQKKEPIAFPLCEASRKALISSLEGFPIRNINVFPANEFEDGTQENSGKKKKVHSSFKPLSEDLEHIAKVYAENQTLRRQKPSYAKIQSRRAKLPSYLLKEEVCQLIKANQITLVSGETGPF